MKKIYILFLVALSSTLASAQNLQWARSMGGTGVDFGQAISVDNAGNVYSTGLFMNTADFDPGAGTFNLTSAGTVDVFTMKLDVSGNFMWANRFGGTGDDHGNSVALDASANAYVTGYFTGNTSGIANLNSAGQTDIFIIKITSAGTLAWAKKMGSTGLDEGNAITVSSTGNVYSTGTFQVTVDFNPGGGNYNLTCTGGPYWDVYIQKLDAAGNFVWANQIGSVFEDRGFAIATDAAENVYTTGYFSDVADFDPGPGVYNLTGNSNSKDAFIQKLNAAGNLVWAKNVGSWLMDQGCSIAVDATGNVYTAGFFVNTADFDPGSGVYNLTATGMDDIFILKLDASGNFLWSIKFGAGINDIGYASLTATGGSVYASGFFGQTVDFDPGPGTWNLTAAGANDVFVIKLNEIQVLPVELLSFTAVPVDNSKIKLNWVTATEINNDYFTVERSADANNWQSVTQVDGNGNTNTTIAYEAWDFTPYNGISYYRLKQTDFDGQFSYSSTVAVNLAASNGIIISLNSATNELVVWSQGFSDQAEITVYNTLGEIIYTRHPSSVIGQLTISVADFPSGVYLVKLQTFVGINTGKFVKE